MELQKWIPLLISRKEIIISHIERFFPPNADSKEGTIVVMDKNGKTYNRKPRATDKENIINGELFLIYTHSNNVTNINEEEDAEISLDNMTELLSNKQNEKFIQTCASEKADTFVQKVHIFKRDFPDEYSEYEHRDSVFSSLANFCKFIDIPNIYDKILKSAQESKSIAEYLRVSFSDNKQEKRSNNS